MTKFRLFINTCAISTLAASHPGYNFGIGRDLGTTHPAYGFGSSTDLGSTHPGYGFGNSADLGATHPGYGFGNSADLGATHPGYGFNEDLGIRPTNRYIRIPNLALIDKKDVPTKKYQKDEDITIYVPTGEDNPNLDQDLGVHKPTKPSVDISNLDQDLGVHKPTKPSVDISNLDQDLDLHRPAKPRVDIHNLDQNLDLHKPTTPKTETEADDSDKTSDTSCSKFVKKFTLIQNPNISANTTSKGRSGNVGSRAAAAGNAVSAATDAGESGENAQFRFGLSPNQIKLSIRRRMHFKEENDGSVYSNALNTLEKTLDSTQAIRNNGKGMTFWVSGIYAQGSTDSMFGNPASTDKHYGIIAGTHYKHEPTQQIFGVAFDVGTGRSIAKTNKDQKTDTKMAQLTLYYNKMLSKNCKFSWCNSFTNEWEHHQRPFINSAGAQQIATSDSIDQEFTSNIGIGYKQEFSKDSYLEPFFSFNYTFTKQFAHREKNVGADNISYNSNSSDQIGLQFGIKSSFGTEISDSKTFVVMPKLSYTIFAKMSNVTQKSVNISSGQASMSQSGTPGRHLLSATIAVGIADHQADTTTRIAYTGNVQKQRRSHEVMVDWSLKF